MKLLNWYRWITVNASLTIGFIVSQQYNISWLSTLTLIAFYFTSFAGVILSFFPADEREGTKKMISRIVSYSKGHILLDIFYDIAMSAVFIFYGYIFLSVVYFIGGLTLHYFMLKVRYYYRLKNKGEQNDE